MFRSEILLQPQPCVTQEEASGKQRRGIATVCYLCLFLLVQLSIKKKKTTKQPYNKCIQ